MGNHNRPYGEDEGADEMNLSKQIKRLREEARFSQEELSEKFTFLVKQFQIGKMNEAIQIFIICYC